MRVTGAAVVRRLVAFGATTAGIAALGAVAQARPTEPQPAERPNVVVVMTDDQTLASMSVMPRTNALIGDQGTSFANSFVSFPHCCPSRATLLTGQYAHNHRVMNNIPPRGGFERLKGAETLAVWLRRAGYTTGLIGKYLNGYEESAVGVPPGYDEWYGQKTQNTYYGFELLENGTRVRYGSLEENPDDPQRAETYSTDVFTDKAADFISRRSPARRPFFLWVSYNAPHSGFPDPPPEHESRCRGQAKPAARHLGAFEGAPLPMPPSFNEPDVSDKPPQIRAAPPLTEFGVAGVTALYRCELESLLAVDEGVERIVRSLDAAGELDDTVIIFTSDNGMLHGEHRMAFGKNLPYEEAIRVPLLMRGPGIPTQTTVRELVSNVDLAPTILQLAGARARLPQDGRSLLPMLATPGRERGREIVIEGNLYSGVRTARYLLAHYTRRANAGSRELYDLERDPFQLESIHDDPAYAAVRRALEKRLRRIRDCAGAECRTKPSLALVLRKSGGGRAGRCPRGTNVLMLAGNDATRAVEARFFLRRRLMKVDRQRPLSARISARRLTRAKPTVRAEVSLRDGRRIDLRTTVPRCPGR